MVIPQGPTRLLLPFFVLFANWTGLVREVRAAEPASRPAVGELRRECDALIESAVKRRYGWAWPADAGEQAGLPRGAALVSYEPTSTPAAGLVLWMAGQRLNEPRYLEAARMVAKGMAAAQLPSGRIPGTAVFGTAPARREVDRFMADRSQTCASLGMLLSMLDGQLRQDQDEATRRTAARATRWLVQQQAPNGAWATLVTPPDDDQPVRLVRLDTTDYRNCIYAMILGFDVLEENLLRVTSNRAIDRLLQLRLRSPDLAAGLWQTAYELSGTPAMLPQSMRESVDVLASARATQAILASALAPLSHAAALETTQAASHRLEKLRYDDGLWRRAYLLSELTKPPTGQASRAGPLFATTRPVAGEPNPYETGDFGLSLLLERINGTQLNPKPSPTTLHHQLAMAVTGIGGGALGRCTTATTAPKMATRAERVAAILEKMTGL